MVRTTLLTLMLLAAMPPAASTEALHFRDIAGGTFRSTLRVEGEPDERNVASFQLMERPVSRRQFLDFLQAHPQWRREQAPTLFVDSGYLADLADEVPASELDRPVAHVSWFAADAYCKSQGARLPDWIEWEYVAAADDHRVDARDDVRQLSLRVNDGTPRAIDARPDATPNLHGVRGMHGAYWEWVDDYSTLLTAGEQRAQDDGDRLKFCGATALSFNHRDDYAVLKRVAVLSAMQSRSTLGNLGFRCARSQP